MTTPASTTTIDWDLVIKIVVPFSTLVAGIFLNRWLERRPKLLAYIGHIGAFTLRGQAGDTGVNTHSVVVANGGRKTASNVRLGHHYLPDFQLNPSVPCTTSALPSGGHELVLPQLVPGEQVTISYLYFAPVTWSMINSYVKSDEGLATIITVLPTRQYGRWTVRFGRVVLVVGLLALAYLAVIGVRALMRLL